MKSHLSRWLILLVGFAAVLPITAPRLYSAPAAPGSPYKVAIFVSNRADCEYDDKLASLEDYIIARVTDLGLSVISRETALNAAGKLDPNAPASALDEQMARDSTAVRLAQALGADYLLQVSLSSVGNRKSAVDAYGVKTVNDERSVRVTYKILDGATGGSVTADTVRAARVVQTTATAAEENDDVINDLLDEAAGKVAASLQSRIERGRMAAPGALGELVSVTIKTEVADLMIPDVRVDGDNTVTIAEGKFKVSPLSATIEVDGLAVGSAPGTVEVRPGLHKLRVTREGFAPWERTVNFTKGQQMTVALTMSADGYARWQDATAFLNDLKNGAKLTDAAVKVLEGRAKMLEQSGFKVNVNTKEGIKFEQRSIFGL